jgi:hypothetical protein
MLYSTLHRTCLVLHYCVSHCHCISTCWRETRMPLNKLIFLYKPAVLGRRRLVRVYHFRIFSWTCVLVYLLLLQTCEVLLLLYLHLLLVKQLCLELHLHLELLLSEGLRLCRSPFVLDSVHVRNIGLKLLTKLVVLYLVNKKTKFYYF